MQGCRDLAQGATDGPVACGWWPLRDSPGGMSADNDDDDNDAARGGATGSGGPLALPPAILHDPPRLVRHLVLRTMARAVRMGFNVMLGDAAVVLRDPYAVLKAPPFRWEGRREGRGDGRREGRREAPGQRQQAM